MHRWMLTRVRSLLLPLSKAMIAASALSAFSWPPACFWNSCVLAAGSTLFVSSVGSGVVRYFEYAREFSSSLLFRKKFMSGGAFWSGGSSSLDVSSWFWATVLGTWGGIDLRDLIKGVDLDRIGS